MTKDLLKEYLVDWFKGYGSWHDDGSMVIYDEEHLHEFCNELAGKIWKKFNKKKKPSGTFDQLWPGEEDLFKKKIIELNPKIEEDALKGRSMTLYPPAKTGVPGHPSNCNCHQCV
jgi:hypothetical protein